MTQPNTQHTINAKPNGDNLTEQTIKRHEQLHNWLATVFDGDFQVDSLPGDASFRCYHRVYLPQTATDLTSQVNNENQHDHDRQEGYQDVYIVMDAPPEKESVIEFVEVAEMMAGVVNVPDIVAKDIDAGFLVLQDFGSTEFAHLLIDATAEQIDAYYKQAMTTLQALQTLEIDFAKTKANLPDYDAALLEREMDLFTDWFVPHIGQKIQTDDDKSKLWETFKQQVMTSVLAQPKVVVHRDYHSRNLMQDRVNPENLGVIDFQDAVIGSYTYDLVSLLRDAYVHWNEKTIDGWAKTFWQDLNPNLKQQMSVATYEQFYQDMMIMGLQRHLKVLGIFVRLAKRDGKTRYLADIPKVMDDLLFELNWLANNAFGDIKPVANEFLEWLKTDIEPAYQHTFLKSE